MTFALDEIEVNRIVNGSPATGTYAQSQTPMYRYSRKSVEDVDDELSSGTTMQMFESQVPRRTNDLYVRNSALERVLEAPMLPGSKIERARDYKGRIRIWPGVLLLLLIMIAAGVGITTYAIQTRNMRRDWALKVARNKFDSSRIKGGAGGDDNELFSDDGIIGNPKKYPPSKCQLPDYQSKKGLLYAVAENGTEVPFSIKGINWFGMETGQGIPFGLWDNADNGTTAYQIALFLSNNKFNGVRLPLMIDYILRNKAPDTTLINKQENRAVSVKNYISLLKSIITTLQYRKIAVLISMHTMTATDTGGLWYSDDISVAQYLKAVDILTSNLCSHDYWNLIGLDLKNEPFDGTWGDGSEKDFRLGAKLIAERMLKGCPSWLGFVEGIKSMHTDGELTYGDWYGGGLQGVKEYGLKFSIPNKVVWAPHYYSPAVYPQTYLYGGGTRNEETGAYDGYVELSDADLRSRVNGTMTSMFGYLAGTVGPAILLGEFGGLYSTDEHPMKTTQRVIDFVIDAIRRPGWVGGFVWSLNPESKYQYNPADVGTNTAFFPEGVLHDDWLTVNEKYIEGLMPMDKMKYLRQLPCFPIKT